MLSTMVLHLPWVAVTAFCLAGASAQGQPVLSTIATIPELSTFSSVVNASGGTQLNPALEERFNSALDGRNYTALVPTNDAFARVSPDLVKAFTAAPAYPLFEAIIRTHIAEGLFTSANIASGPVEAIEGFSLSAVASTSTAGVFVNEQAEIVAVDTFASNGVVHQLDQVLNPFTAYFGISNATTPPQATEAQGTVADILLTDERLTGARDVLLALQPDLVRTRLGLAKPGGAPQIFAAPSNDAFAAAPPGTAASSTAPSNQALSLLLFGFGLLDTDARLADLDLSGGPLHVASAPTGINVTARQVGGATFLNNAAVQEQVCGSNGCVWLVDRILDPLYLEFGPLGRGS